MHHPATSKPSDHESPRASALKQSVPSVYATSFGYHHYTNPGPFSFGGEAGHPTTSSIETNGVSTISINDATHNPTSNNVGHHPVSFSPSTQSIPHSSFLLNSHPSTDANHHHNTPSFHLNHPQQYNTLLQSEADEWAASLPPFPSSSIESSSHRSSPPPVPRPLSSSLTPTSTPSSSIAAANSSPSSLSPRTIDLPKLNNPGPSPAQAQTKPTQSPPHSAQPAHLSHNNPANHQSFSSHSNQLAISSSLSNPAAVSPVPSPCSSSSSSPRSSPPQSPKSNKRKRSDQERREKHNDTERKGRQKINNEIKVLKALLPELQNSAAPKVSVLQCAVDTLKRKTEHFNSLMTKFSHLREENEILHLELNRLRQLHAGGCLPPPPTTSALTPVGHPPAPPSAAIFTNDVDANSLDPKRNEGLSFPRHQVNVSAPAKQSGWSFYQQQ